MHFYLKNVNPIIALIVALLCFWAATYTDKGFKIEGIVVGGMSTYFFAKGLFSASAVYLLGRILLEIVSGRANEATPKYKRLDFLYLAGLFVIIISLLLSILILHEDDDSSKAKSVELVNPKEISIIESYRVKESSSLRIGGKLKNNSDIVWRSVNIYSNFFVDGIYYCSAFDQIRNIRPDEERFFQGACHDIKAADIRGNVTYELKIKADKVVQKK